MTPKWIERARETYKYHRAKCILEPGWNLTKTAQALRRGLGPVSEDIKIASWLKTHGNQIEQFNYAYEALEFIRKKQKEIDLADLDS
jgi:hypothetical protein